MLWPVHMAYVMKVVVLWALPLSACILLRKEKVSESSLPVDKC